MYKHILAIALFLLSFSACGKSEEHTSSGGEIPQEISIELSVTQVDASSPKGSYTVNVTTNAERWTASKSLDWITLTTNGTSSSSGTVTITLSANEGDARSGNVIISSGTKSERITVNQAAAFRVSKPEFMVWSGGSTVSVTLSGSQQWSATTEEPWISTERINDATLDIQIAPTEERSTRKGTVTVVSGEEEKTVTILQEPVEETAITTPEGYELVWHDEFNEGNLPDEKRWTHEVQGKGWVNNELQIYVDGEHNGRRVTELSDGKLRINCFNANGSVYSGRIYAEVETGWLYGYFEARILLPKGKGTWPAFWMMPVGNNYTTNPWPGCGEIDIMEEVGADANYVSATIHCNKYNNGNTAIEHASRHLPTAESDYHVYACEWTPTNLRFFVDGKEILDYHDTTDKNSWPFTYAFYPILNLAWGGAWGGYKGVDESALPVTMSVDYVRVFQKKEE